MAKFPALNSEEARRKAEDRFRKAKQRESDAETAYEELAKQKKAEATKTNRLRALRLAKEAADAEAARRAQEAKDLAGAQARRRKASQGAAADPKEQS